AETIDGSVGAGSLGLSGDGWSGLAAVRRIRGRMVAARRGSHPGQPVDEPLRIGSRASGESSI
ncbi:MAG: hypothetical protein ACM3KE_13615, partial [Hyphomicrobiales bacterium]